MNIQGWFHLGLIGLIFLQFKGLSRVLSSISVWKHQFFGAQPSLWSNVIAMLDDYRVMPVSDASIQSPVLPSLFLSGSYLDCALRLSKSCGYFIFDRHFPYYISNVFIPLWLLFCREDPHDALPPGQSLPTFVFSPFPFLPTSLELTLRKEALIPAILGYFSSYSYTKRALFAELQIFVPNKETSGSHKPLGCSSNQVQLPNLLFINTSFPS